MPMFTIGGDRFFYDSKPIVESTLFPLYSVTYRNPRLKSNLIYTNMCSMCLIQFTCVSITDWCHCVCDSAFVPIDVYRWNVIAHAAGSTHIHASECANALVWTRCTWSHVVYILHGRPSIWNHGWVTASSNYHSPDFFGEPLHSEYSCIWIFMHRSVAPPLFYPSWRLTANVPYGNDFYRCMLTHGSIICIRNTPTELIEFSLDKN